MPTNGDLISGRYEIIKKIASGGMADIYLGQDIKLKRKVAIKILSENFSNNKSFVARFKREAQILARLNHQNIVSVYDWGNFDGYYFICMEYIEGLSLKEIIERKGIINPRLAAKYAIGICGALEVAHSNNLIHRDIKPQNILITKENIVKVTDFGIAKSVVDDATKTINIIGTASYISPEQASGKNIDCRTDIYSVGVVLYEMLTADIPFRGENSIEISLKHINEKPVKPSALVDSIMPDIERIVLHCLEKNPENRYPSISNLKKDLQNFLYNKKLLIYKHKEKKRIKNSILRPIFKGFNILNVITFIIILALVFLTIFYSVKYYNLKGPKPVTVPSMENIDYQKALKLAGYMDLNLVRSREEYSQELEKNVIIDQEPEEGNKVYGGTDIKVVVSKGPEKETIKMPNLIGLDLEYARSIVEKEDIKIGEIEEKYSDYSKNIIIGQNPEFNQEVEANSKIDVIISLGSEKITIPNIVGADYLYAKSHLQSLSLSINYEPVFNNNYPAGTIVEIIPAPGSEIEKNTVVNIKVSTSQEMVILPDLRQVDLNRAISMLDSLGIKYITRNIEASYSVQKGLVLEQFPEAGKYVLPESEVILFVGS